MLCFWAIQLAFRSVILPLFLPRYETISLTNTWILLKSGKAVNSHQVCTYRKQGSSRDIKPSVEIKPTTQVSYWSVLRLCRSTTIRLLRSETGLSCRFFLRKAETTFPQLLSWCFPRPYIIKTLKQWKNVFV